MRIKHRLDIGFGILIVMLATVAGLSVWSLSHAQHASGYMDNTFRQQVCLAQLLMSANQGMRELGEYVLTGDNDELEEFRAYEQATVVAFDDWKHLILDECDHFDRESDRSASQELEAWNHCHQQYIEMARVCNRVVEMVQSGRRLQAIDLMEQRVEILHDETVAKTIREQLREERTEIAGVRHATWKLYGFAWRLTAGVTIFAIVCAGLASRLVTRRIARPLGKLREAAVRIGQGHLDTEVNVTSRDEIGELAATLNQMAHDLKQSTASVDELRDEVCQRQHVEKQLEAANEELTHFAYVVSHDLKAPLRGIKLLTDWLSSDYADKLGEEAAEQLALLQNRVQRMHDLIDGVLRYSRIGRTETTLVSIDLNELLDDVVDAVSPPEHIQVTVRRPLPTISGDRTRVSQVFQNLMSNAIKYLDKPRGNIIVACDDGPDTWTFSVSDNGPGIEPKYFERIFQIFQTLASKDDFESTGVGLTLVKKIVEQHGGTVWVASEVGQGSTFYFTWPKQQTPCRPESSRNEDDAGQKQNTQNVPAGSPSNPGRTPC